ncbi:MAG TPA: lamin tail domain-containing protein, partial [Opitutales bacterium]|nr:lamin tail domain-containing protein [Opitutales bacterium]
FAGGNPTGLFGGAIVQKATAGNFGYGDTGDIIVLASGGADVISFDYTASFPSVYMGVTRSPDITGSYVLYNTVATAGELFSPGTKINGEPFGSFTNTLHLALSRSTVPENESAPVTATVTLSNPAPAGGLLVSISTNGMIESTGGLVADEINIAELQITVPEGSKTATFNIYAHNDGVLDGDKTVSVVVRAADAVPAMADLTVTEVMSDPYKIVINEAMPSLAGTDMDYNGNGTSEEAINDQFIEIVNTSGRTVDMSGWKLYSFAKNDTNGEVCVHVFAKATKIANNGSIVIFGGGKLVDMQAAAATIAGGATVLVSNSGGVGVNLTTSDDGVIRLVNQFGYVVDEVLYDSSMADQLQSITRSPDATGDFGFLHLALSGMNFLAASPGTKVDGTAFSGNGLIAKTAYETIFSDYYLYTEDFYYSDVFGWTYVTAWPYLYSFDFNAWVYVSPEASKSGEIYFYSFVDGTWYYTSPALYPWGWDMTISNWALIY